MAQKYSPTYTELLRIIVQTKFVKNPVYRITVDGNKLTRVKLDDTSDGLDHSFTITDSDITAQFNMVESHLVLRISRELKMYNALWHCTEDIRRNSSNRKAIKHLVELFVLIETETKHIYLVNPLYFRRGEFSAVIFTTAKLLENTNRVQLEHITDKRSVREHILKAELPTIGYGYNE